MTITVYTPAHVSTSVLNCLLLCSPPRRSLLQARCHRNFSLTCALLPEKRRESRRLVNIALEVLLQWLALPKDAVAGSPFDKYVKRKQLDPLEAYVPAVLLAGVQIKELEKYLGFFLLQIDDQLPKKFSYLLIQLQVAQYAADGGNGKSAFSDVDQCLSLLKTVPADVLEKGKSVADSYFFADAEDVAPERLDPDLKQLESIL